jgi:lipoprotein-releasing system ATP-binding protein
MAEALLQVEGVVKDYGERVKTRVLHGVDLSIQKGELCALIGPSGSGKSTLLNIMALLDRPTSGRVLIDGEDTTRLGDRALTRFRGRKIGFVFQFHHLLGAFTAAENVLMPMFVDEGRISGAMRRRAAELLDQVGLKEKLNAKATDLSGGQQQRVAIARALASNPPLVLADEPTGNLDSETSFQVFELMRRFNREQGTGFLVVTHDPRLADQCDRVINLVDGRVTADHVGVPSSPCRACGLAPKKVRELLQLPV